MSMYPIASYTASSTQSSSFAFLNIPQTFTHLQLRIWGRGGATGTYGLPYLFVNADSGTGNYRWHSFNGNGTTTASTNGTDNAFDLPLVSGPGSLANVYGSVIVDILDYTNTNKNKVIKAIGGFDDNNASTTNSQVALVSGLYLTNTNPITRLDFNIYDSGSSIISGTRIDLYGITTSNVGTF